MNKNKLMISIMVALLWFGSATGQFKSQLKSNHQPYPQVEQRQVPFISLFDPNRLRMNHGFSLSIASFGGQTVSTGIYSNRLQYLISDRWTLNTRLDFVQPTLSSSSSRMNGLNEQVYYGIQLQYNPTPSFFLNMSVNNYPLLYYRPLTRFSPILYRHK